MFDRTGSTDRGVRSRLGRGLVVLLAAGGLVAIPGTPAPGGSAAEPGTCWGQTATIVDLREGAVVEGTAGRDVILVGAAATVHAGKEHDYICGTGKLYGGGGPDWIFLRDVPQLGDPLLRMAFGGSGHDYIRGSKHVDYLSGGSGRDYVLGEGDADVLVGGADQDWLVGGGGDDRLWGGDSRDHLQGGQGQDTLGGGYGHDLILGGLGADRMRGEFGNDRLFGGPGVDQARGGFGLDECRSETMYSCEGPLLPIPY